MVLIWMIKVVFYNYLFIYLFIYFLVYERDADLTYHQRNKDVMLNKAKDYYKNDKERLREQARNKYRNLSEEEKKNKKREHGKKRYHSMSEEKKQRLKEYQKVTMREKSLNITMSEIIF